MTVEPGVYVPGEVGVRIEDLVIVGEVESEVLTRLPEGPRDDRLMALAALAALVGASIQAATGFGFALVLSPALFAVLDPTEAVATLLALGLVLNVFVLIEDGGHANWRRIAPMLLAALPGLVAGLLLLEALSKEALQISVGLAVIGAAALQLSARRAANGRAAPTPSCRGPPGWPPAS